MAEFITWLTTVFIIVEFITWLAIVFIIVVLIKHW